MKKKLLVFGGSGMLGSMVLDYLSKNTMLELHVTLKDPKLLGKLVQKYKSVIFHKFEAEDMKALKVLEAINPDWIINCIGVIKPQINESNALNVKNAIYINSIFPFEISSSFPKSKIIQIATDCVFSGIKGDYSEISYHDPIDVYGKTKSLGEVKSDNFIHIRCSIIGPEIKNNKSILEWFLKHTGKKIDGYTNHRWNGITTLHFAKLCEAIISSGMKIPNVLHFLPKDKVTKYKLLMYIKEVYKKNVVIEPVEAREKINRALSTSQNQINTSLWEKMGYSFPPSIKAMIEELNSYK